MASIAVGVMAITAAYNFSVYVGGYSELIGTAYGLTVLAKIIPFLAIFALGAFNRYICVLLLDEWAGLPPLSRSLIDRFAARFFPLFIKNQNGINGSGYCIALRFKRLVRIEAFLVITLLLCTSLLGYEVPLPVMHTWN